MSQDCDTDVIESTPTTKSDQSYRVALACPMYDDRMTRHTHRALMTATFGKRHRVAYMSESTSLLSHTFNTLWCRAIGRQEGDQQFTHFCMLHADISPQPGWLDRMIEEMEAVGADVLSVHSPIKDTRGLTSTAVDVTGLWTNVRRFTLKEVNDDLPATFDNAGCGYPGRPLLVNTGCLLVDLRKPWIRQVCFQVSSRLVWNVAKSGLPVDPAVDNTWLNERVFVVNRPDLREYTILVDPEDWDFSRQAHEAGARVFATRKVQLEHWGGAMFSNHLVQGTWERDDDFFDEEQPTVKEELVTDGTS